jgi:hypothetical protein
MRLQDTVTIAEFGPYRIDAIYDYRIEVPYGNKHDGPDINDIHVDKVELKIQEVYLNLDRTEKTRVPLWKTLRTVTLLDIPPWLWELLNSPSMLKELDLDTEPDPDEQRDAQQDRAFSSD